jgi:GDP-D-mannose dehydratase
MLDLDIEQYIKQDDSLLRPRDRQVIFGDNSKVKDRLNWEYNLKQNRK